MAPLSVTQQKQHLHRMCLETKQVIGRKEGTKGEIKAGVRQVQGGGENGGENADGK